MAGDLGARLATLLRRYAQLELPSEFDAAALDSLVRERQDILEQIERLDSQQEILRHLIASSPALQEILHKIATLDRKILERTTARRDALHSALAKNAPYHRPTPDSEI